MAFKSITYGKLKKEEMFSIIADKIKQEERIGRECALVVGTDSQAHSKTRIVSVVSLHTKGYGGLFFSETTYVDRFKDLRSKIYNETQLSITLAKELLEYLFENDILIDIVIHSDIGKNGKTNELISEITGWVASCGFPCEIKPNATTASTIADRITK